MEVLRLISTTRVNIYKEYRMTIKLKIKGNGKPSLFIFDNCKNTCREMASYHYPSGSSTKNPKDVPEGKDDHCCDALRYVIYTVGRPRKKGHICV